MGGVLGAALGPRHTHKHTTLDTSAVDAHTHGASEREARVGGGGDEGTAAPLCVRPHLELKQDLGDGVVRLLAGGQGAHVPRTQLLLHQLGGGVGVR